MPIFDAFAKIGTHHALLGTMQDGQTRLFDDLAVFVCVAQNAGFSVAARQLKRPLTNVSRSVARLEDAVGVKLLQRTSRRVQVTDEGRQLLLGVATHLDGIDEALAAASDRRPELSGVVRVTAPAYTGSTRVSLALADFALAHPGVGVELDASNARHDLIRDGFDFAIRPGPIEQLDFVVRRLWQGEFGLFAARSFVQNHLEGNLRLGRRDLAAAPCVVLRSNAVWRFRDDKGRDFELTPSARFAVNDPRAAVEVARRGVGIVLAPVDAVAPEVDFLRLVPEFGEPLPVDLFVVYPSRRLLPRRVRAAIEWIAQLRYVSP